DYIQAIFVDREQLYLMGTEASEVWQNDTNGVLTRIPGAEANIGMPARYGICSTGTRVYFLSGSRRGQCRLMRLNGFTPEPVSTHAEEQAWSSNAALSTVTGLQVYSYEESGHVFVVVADPLIFNASFVYDETESARVGTPIWHRRARVTYDLFQQMVIDP